MVIAIGLEQDVGTGTLLPNTVVTIRVGTGTCYRNPCHLDVAMAINT